MAKSFPEWDVHPLVPLPEGLSPEMFAEASALVSDWEDRGTLAGELAIEMFKLLFRPAQVDQSPSGSRPERA